MTVLTGCTALSRIQEEVIRNLIILVKNEKLKLGT